MLSAFAPSAFGTSPREAYDIKHTHENGMYFVIVFGGGRVGAVFWIHGCILLWDVGFIIDCMTENIKSLMEKMKKGLTELYGQRLKAVYLFGSYARGDFHEGSDLDVMIVLDTYKSYWDELVRSAELASDLSLEYDVTVSRMIMTEEQWKKGDLPVLRNIRAEGVPA
jgi:predicted nucleotidyltransferase